MTDFRTRKKDGQVFPTSSGKEYRRKDDYPSNITYYRAIHDSNFSDSDKKLLQPKPTPHEMDRDGKVVYKIYCDEPVFARSDEPILAFSKTKEGAVTGAVTSDKGFRKGVFHIVKTKEKPDVDLSEQQIGDFYIIKEVRYKKPIKVSYVEKVEVSPEATRKVANYYRKDQPDRAIETIKKEIKQ